MFTETSNIGISTFMISFLWPKCQVHYSGSAQDGVVYVLEPMLQAPNYCIYKLAACLAEQQLSSCHLILVGQCTIQFLQHGSIPKNIVEQLG